MGFDNFKDTDTPGDNVKIVDSVDPSIQSRVIPDEDLINRVQVDAKLKSGELVPTITNKLRFRYNIADVILSASPTYDTIYTRNGEGLFFGFQLDFNNDQVNIRLTIDGGQVFDISLDDVRAFQFNDTTTGRIQRGGFLTTVGNTFDFSSRFAIPYSTTVLIEATANNGNPKLTKYMVIQTEDA